MCVRRVGWWSGRDGNMASMWRTGLVLFFFFVFGFFFFNDTATTEIYTLSLHDALPISLNCRSAHG